MIQKNVVNISKKNSITGTAFHLFYADIATSYLFDADLSEPIIWGNKSIVMTQLKNISNLMNVDPISKVIVFSYIMSNDGYRRIDTYNGPIATIGKYIRRY